MKLPHLIYLLLVFTVFSCLEKKPIDTAVVALPSVIVKQIFRSSQNCVPDSASCTYAKIKYPEFTDSTRWKLNDFIHQKIEAVVSEYISEDNANETLVHNAQSFIDDYETFIVEYPEYKFGWFLNVKSEIIYNTEEIVSFSINRTAFTGGAHPNSSTSYFTIDTATLRELSLSDIIGDTLKLKKLLEQEFRNVKGIKENQSLADAGYYLNDGDFSLSNNIGITDESIIVHFNPYEIAPYSLGATTLELNRKTMGSIFNIK